MRYYTVKLPPTQWLPFTVHTKSFLWLTSHHLYVDIKIPAAGENHFKWGTWAAFQNEAPTRPQCTVCCSDVLCCRSLSRRSNSKHCIVSSNEIIKTIQADVLNISDVSHCTIKALCNKEFFFIFFSINTHIFKNIIRTTFAPNYAIFMHRDILKAHIATPATSVLNVCLITLIFPCGL